MPTLIRFLVFCAVIVGIVYAAMFALVLYVDPKPREVIIRVPLDHLDQDMDDN